MLPFLESLQPGDLVLREYKPVFGKRATQYYFTLIISKEDDRYFGYDIRLTNSACSVKLIGDCWSDFGADEIKAVWSRNEDDDYVEPFLLSFVKDVLAGKVEPDWQAEDKEVKDVSEAAT